jgi:hypothetical protein
MTYFVTELINLPPVLARMVVVVTQTWDFVSLPSKNIRKGNVKKLLSFSIIAVTFNGKFRKEFSVGLLCRNVWLYNDLQNFIDIVLVSGKNLFLALFHDFLFENNGYRFVYRRGNGFVSFCCRTTNMYFMIEWRNFRPLPSKSLPAPFKIVFPF